MTVGSWAALPSLQEKYSNANANRDTQHERQQKNGCRQHGGTFIV
jgi:hypothetical protein